VGNGCYSKFDGHYKNNNKNRPRNKSLYDKLPEAFKACHDIHSLCIGCRLFGMMGESHEFVYKGNVSVSDALLKDKINDRIFDDKIFEKFELGAMGGPGPWHTTFYLDKKDKYIAGRKFYYHHYKANNVLHRGAKAKTAIKKGTFTFKVHFQNILKTDFPVLLYSLVLEDTMWHKIGYGKPQGLGSIKIECTKIVLTDQEKRYTDAENATQEYDRDSGLSEFIQEIREDFIAQHPSTFVLDDLRKIWSNEVSADTPYKYPGLDWFDKHGDIWLEDYQKGVRE
jgi:CRISPR-associated protein (TIGR03986 family)